MKRTVWVGGYGRLLVLRRAEQVWRTEMGGVVEAIIGWYLRGDAPHNRSYAVHFASGPPTELVDELVADRADAYEGGSECWC